MDKYILVKYQIGTNGVNSCYLSGITLEEIYSILGSPHSLLLTYNEFDNFCRIEKDDFLKFIQNRREYYDIICSDVSDTITSEQITEQDIKSLQLFTKTNTPNPVLKLPSISQSFCIYSHDLSLYSYICLRTRIQDFAKSFLNWLVYSSTNRSRSEHSFYQTDFEHFLEALQRGIFIDTEHTKIINDNVYLSSGYFDPQTNFADNVFPEKLPKFRFIRLRTE